MDVNELTQEERQESYQMARQVCPTVAIALSLTMVTPKLVESRLQDQELLFQAEGTLQYFLDMLVSMLAAGARTLSIFYTLQRILIMVATESSKSDPSQPLPFSLLPSGCSSAGESGLW